MVESLKFNITTTVGFAGEKLYRRQISLRFIGRKDNTIRAKMQSISTSIRASGESIRRTDKNQIVHTAMDQNANNPINSFSTQIEMAL